jgi:hypothetical protein
VREADQALASANQVMNTYQCWNCSSHIKTRERVAPGARAREMEGNNPYGRLKPTPPGVILEQRRCVDPTGKPLYEDPEHGRPCPCSDKPCTRADPCSRRVR